MDTDPVPLITPSDIMEYIFCPRSIYFMYAVGFPQYEEIRYKVQKGRMIHKIRQSRNLNYMWKKIGCVGREVEVYLSSYKLNLRGIVDEILTLSDGTLSPMDYKFAFYKEPIYRTHRFQSMCYALLIRENYKKPVKRGFILYTRSNTFKEIEYRKKDEEELQRIIQKMLRIMRDGYFPKGSSSKARCLDCAYRHICYR